LPLKMIEYLELWAYRKQGYRKLGYYMSKTL